MVNNDYQHDSRVLYTFAPNKSFGSFLDISPSNHIFLKTFSSEYDEIVVWFTDQNCKSLEIEDRINLTMVIKQCWIRFHCIKMRYSIEPRDRVYVKGYGFMSFTRSMSNKYGKETCRYS